MGLSDHGLAFDLQGEPLSPGAVGQAVQLDFDFQGRHHACRGLIVHVQDRRTLLSLRGATTNVLATLPAAGSEPPSSLAARLATLQAQQACHAEFMRHMKGILDDFFRLLPGRILARRNHAGSALDSSELAGLQTLLDTRRPLLFRFFTEAYPMHPELQDALADSKSAGAMAPVDMDKVDDWIRRTTVARDATDALGPLFDDFNRQYGALLGSDSTRVAHPFQPDALLDALADLVRPLNLSLECRAFCYELLADAFRNRAAALYADLLRRIGDVPAEPAHALPPDARLEEWLQQVLAAPAAAHDGAGSTGNAPIRELTALLAHLTQDATGKNAHAAGPRSGAGLAVRERIFGRFVPAATPGFGDVVTRLHDSLARLEEGAGDSGVGHALGGLADLDLVALQGLYASMRQPPPIDLGPEKLPQASQVRAMMLQAQGLLLEFSLNGLTYQAQPDHPAWVLINALDALHRGADNNGQFLDPSVHQIVSLAMQWLLSQENVDAALGQVNGLLQAINARFLEERSLRRAQILQRLGDRVEQAGPIASGWCVVKRDGEAIPYELLGRHDGSWALLDRSASTLLELPTDEFIGKLDRGEIEEAESFDKPFLERIANATLTASLDAVHAFTWRDPASGCLKRSALIDELERRLAHPVSAPPSYCALIEIPAMRPGMSSLPRDELAVFQKRTGEMLLEALQSGEHCGRLSDVSFLMVFAPQDPARLAGRLSSLKTAMDGLNPEWRMTGAVVPLIEGDAEPTPSNVLRRANHACSALRRNAEIDLSLLDGASPSGGQIDPLPFSSLYLRCQKIAPCGSEASAHYEILLGVDEDLVPRHTTQSFVVMAEQMDRIHDLDRWVLQSALEWMASHSARLEPLSGLSINLSGGSLARPGHVDAMVELLAGYAHLADKVIFEVTETAAIDNLDSAAHALRKLRRLGCRVALDDFGSGYSSYGYLRRLPLDYLKIDGAYVRNLLTDKTDEALTASMVDVAHALGLKVIAEFVESEAVYSRLKELGVDYVQGNWIHAPERLDGLVLE